MNTNRTNRKILSGLALAAMLATSGCGQATMWGAATAAPLITGVVGGVGGYFVGKNAGEAKSDELKRENARLKAENEKLKNGE